MNVVIPRPDQNGGETPGVGKVNFPLWVEKVIFKFAVQCTSDGSTCRCSWSIMTLLVVPLQKTP